jgi:signal transduction histidine kinase
MGVTKVTNADYAALVYGSIIVDRGGRAIYLSESVRSALKLKPGSICIPLSNLGLGNFQTIQLTSALEKVVSTGRPTSIVLSVSADGLWQWECGLTPSMVADGPVDSVIVTIMNVTSRSETSPVEGGRRDFEAVLSKTPGAMVIIGGEDFKITLVNNVARKALDIEPGELNGADFREAFHISGSLQDQIATVQKEGGASSVNIYGGRTSEGRDIFYSRMVVPIKKKDKTEISIFTNDVTASINEKMKELTADLADAKAHLEAILRVLPVGVVIIGPKGEILETNDAIGTIWGTPQISGPPSLGRPDDATEDGSVVAICRKISDEVGHGATFVSRKEAIVRADGTVGWALLSAAPLKTETSGSRGTVAAVHDITEIVKLENELRCKTEALSRSNAELQQFAYVASHDLREPLRMVSSYLELLVKKYDGQMLDATAKEYIHFAIDGADRMQQMINDLLAYSRVGTQGKMFEMVEMDDVLDTALTDLKPAIAESRPSVTREPLPVIIADKTQMLMLMENLLSNAIKFRGEEPPQIHIAARGTGTEWTFSVQDHGIGIDRKYQDRLFHMFQRLHTREEYPGTGIGLAIAKRIVERHGGRIWFESEPGKGTTFFFTIPIGRTDSQVC